jgi:hypothetical protein
MGRQAGPVRGNGQPGLGGAMWLMSNIETAAFIVIVALMMAMALMVA